MKESLDDQIADIRLRGVMDSIQSYHQSVMNRGYLPERAVIPSTGRHARGDGTASVCYTTPRGTLTLIVCAARTRIESDRGIHNTDDASWGDLVDAWHWLVRHRD